MKITSVFNKINISSIVIFQVAIFELKYSSINRRQLLSHKEPELTKVNNFFILNENYEIKDKLKPKYIFRVNSSDNLNKTNGSGTQY